MLLMTAPHYNSIKQRLQLEGYNVADLEQTGRLVFQDAGQLVAKFFVDEVLDESYFKASLGHMIEKARWRNGNRPVRIFGEIVSLIWEGNPKVTLRMEELWSQVIEQYSVPLLCAYALHGHKRGGSLSRC